MQKLWNAMLKLPISDLNFLFVCYESGSGGENLSAEISKMDPCFPLEFYTTEQGRTIITSDYFEKIFLYSVGPMEKLLQFARNIVESKPVGTNKIQVSPSHWDFDFLLPYFPNSKFIRIVHDNPELIHQNRVNKINKSKFKTFVEFTGFCLIYVKKSTLAELLKQKKIFYEMEIGQILTVLLNHMDNHEHSVFRSDILIDHKQVFNLQYGCYKQDQQKILDFILNR